MVLYLAKSRDELACVEQLEASGAKVIARLADGSAPPDFMLDAGAARIEAPRLKELVPDIADREVFVSGSPASVDSLRARSTQCRSPPGPCGLVRGLLIGAGPGRARRGGAGFSFAAQWLLSSRTSHRQRREPWMPS